MYKKECDARANLLFFLLNLATEYEEKKDLQIMTLDRCYASSSNYKQIAKCNIIGKIRNNKGNKNKNKRQQ